MPKDLRDSPDGAPTPPAGSGLTAEQEAKAQTMLTAMFAESRPKSARLLDAESNAIVHRASVSPGAGRTYLPITEAGKSYLAELVVTRPEGPIVLSRSRPILATDEAARDRLSEIVRPF